MPGMLSFCMLLVGLSSAPVAMKNMRLRSPFSMRSSRYALSTLAQQPQPLPPQSTFCSPENIRLPQSRCLLPTSIPFCRHSSLNISLPMLGSDTWDDNMVLQAAKGTNVQVFVSTFYAEGGNKTFDDGIKAYINGNADAKTTNGGDDTISAVTAMGYDVYYVALEALKAAGSTDPAKVMEALPGVTYDGVSGHIAFDETGDAIRDTAYIKTIDTAANVWKFVTQQKAS